MDLAIEPQIERLAEQLFAASSSGYRLTFRLEPYSKEPLGFQGVHKLLIVEARARDQPSCAAKSARLFVKTAVPNCNAHQRDLFEREPKFFGHVVPRLLRACQAEAWAPSCYLAQDALLIFEDLKSQGFGLVRRPFDEAHFRSLFSCLARFHAASMLLEQSQGKSIDLLYPKVFEEKVFTDDGQLTREWLATGIEVARAIADRLGLDSSCIARAYRATLRVAKRSADEPNVICHSDLWRNNAMFDEGGQHCRLVDFQLSAYKCYALDLLEALHLNAGKSARAALEESLIRYYHSQLKQCLSVNGYREKQGRVMSAEEAVEAVNKKRILGLVSAVQILPIALLSKQFSRQLFRDSDSLARHMYVSRKDLVLRAMDVDLDFRQRIEGATIELIDYMRDAPS